MWQNPGGYKDIKMKYRFMVDFQQVLWTCCFAFGLQWSVMSKQISYWFILCSFTHVYEIVFGSDLNKDQKILFFSDLQTLSK